MNCKKIYIILGICLLTSVIAGSTFAWLSWRTATNQQTEIEFGGGGLGLTCSADGGGNITSNDVQLIPTTCDKRENIIKREIKIDVGFGSVDSYVSLDLWLDIDDLSSGLSESENFRWVLSTSTSFCKTGTVGEGVISYGIFNGLTTDDQIHLIVDNIYNSSINDDIYYLYIWLDVDETSSSTMDQDFSLSLNGSCSIVSIGEPFYAVYSADDTSLRFYKEEEGVIVEGEQYEGRTATNVFNAYENDVYTYNSSTTRTTSPWDTVRDNVTKIVIEDEIKPNSLANWFNRFMNVSNIDVTNLNTENVVSMERLFDNAGYNVTDSFSIIGLDTWDVSNVKKMNYMFNQTGYSATTFNIGDLDNWNVLNVMDMGYMFYKMGYTTPNFDIGDLSSWNTLKVLNMNRLFRSTGYTTSTFDVGNLGNWNTSNVMDMYSMFVDTGYSATTFNIGDLVNWDVSSVMDMGRMFSNTGYNATTFNIGNLNNWNVSSVISMSQMFVSAGYNATTFNIGNLDNWDVSSVINMECMFQLVGINANTFNIGNLSNWNVSGVINMSAMFYGIGGSAIEFNNIGDLSNWDVSNVTNMRSMFEWSGTYRNGTTFDIGDISKWDTSNVTNMYRMFKNARFSSTYNVDLSRWNVDKVISYTNFNLDNTEKIIAPVWVNEDQGDVTT